MEIMSREFLSIDQSQPVSQLIGKLAGNDAACIMDGDALVGVFDPGALLKTRVDIAEIKASRVAKAVPRLQPDESIQEIVQHFYDANASMLPVLRDGRIAGVVYIADVLESIKGAVGDLTVRQIRHPRPISVAGDERIDTVLSIMHDEHIDRLPVVGSDGKMIGVISAKDVLMNYYIHHIERDNGQAPKSRTRAFRAELPDLGSLPISNFMNNGDIRTIREDDRLSVAIDEMVKHGVLSLFIVDDGAPVGIVTKRDIIEAFINSTAEEQLDIQYVGLEELDIGKFLKLQVRKLVSHHARKLDRYFDNGFQLMVHIKEYSKTGSRHKFSVHLRVTYPGATVPACDADAWNIRTAIQESFKRLENSLAGMYRHKKETHSPRKTGRVMPGERPE